VSSFDPLTLLPALAVATEKIGLIATASTTYNDPFHIARKFASLDHISEGRSGWNIVTSYNPHEASNFGLDSHASHDERYLKAREFYDVVTGLWDSWADDAFIRDVEKGVYFDPEKLNILNHHGKFLKVRGPLNVARPIQGWPVIVQAGASEAGRQLAAETAEVLFGAANTIEDGKSYYSDIKARMSKVGRDPKSAKILPGAFVVVGKSQQEAIDKKELLDSLIHSDSGIASLSVLLGCDASVFDPNGPLPDIPPSEATQSGRQKMIDMARRDNLTVAELARQVGGSFSSLEIMGTPETIVDQMQEWFEGRACDGFNIMFPFLPQGLDDFVDLVVPELQKRGLFRQKYSGRTLRQHLGLETPKNQFFL
jgi:FMN-dependent oxidoreductase (nitrilotriacetate monooxygenase family)